MRLMVTGGTGFVGSNIVEALLKKVEPNNIALLVRDPSKLLDLGINNIIHTNVFKGDLTDQTSIEEVMKFDPTAIIHSAALVDDWASWSLLKKVNVQGTRNLVNAIMNKTPSSFLVHISSTGVYPRISSVISEKTPLKPFDKYHLSKYESEQVILDAIRRNGLSATILRPPNIMGLRDTTHMAKICQSIKNGKFPLISGGKAIQTWLGGEDLAQAAILALNKQTIARNKIYNLKSFEISVKDLYTLISKKINVDKPPKRYNYHLAYYIGFISEILSKIRGKTSTLNRYRVLKFARDRLFDDSKIRKELGYQPNCTAEVTISKTVDWLIDNEII